MLAAFPANSHAKALGVKEDEQYTDETAAAVKELAKFINNDPDLLARMAGGMRLARAEDLGIADLAFRRAIGAFVPPDAAIPPTGAGTRSRVSGLTHAPSSIHRRHTASRRQPTSSAMNSSGCTGRWRARLSG
ncbi:hypothetical protein MPSYJ_55550 [Mycolicibacterium psychrotolerans]|uniref:Uncharacterized protein n=1 Tax=Mycolicibacterium psychrotolerans TaxID=216929 RepID=A0A7I7MIB4_9MYCO|nr:hypothetical protein MPSYJ_55550 [Mycolicibacterium psychrotolerans]